MKMNRPFFVLAFLATLFGSAPVAKAIVDHIHFPLLIAVVVAFAVGFKLSVEIKGRKKEKGWAPVTLLGFFGAIFLFGLSGWLGAYGFDTMQSIFERYADNYQIRDALLDRFFALLVGIFGLAYSLVLFWYEYELLRD